MSLNVNSTRWSQYETFAIIELWGGHSYVNKNGKIRTTNPEWTRIGQEYNRRMARRRGAQYGPRSRRQCQTRIKRLLKEYQESEQQQQYFPYGQKIKEIEIKLRQTQR